jgi:hypothetical protein
MAPAVQLLVQQNLYAGYDNTDCDEAFTITLTATKNGKTSTTSKTVLVYFCS